jgi:regulator of sigma D
MCEKKLAIYKRILKKMQDIGKSRLQVSFGFLDSSTTFRLILDYNHGSWSILDGRDGYLTFGEAMELLKEVLSKEEYDLFVFQQELAE